MALILCNQFGKDAIMATMNTRQAGAAVRISQFGGIDRRGRVCDMDNLRLRADGSLERRCGFSPVLTLEGKVRGVWSGSFNGAEAAFAAAGDKLYQLDTAAGRASAIGSIAAGEEAVALFLYRGQLCCMDGCDIYLWDGSTLHTVSPYVPLVARERGPMDLHEIYEPINLIGRRARFSFRADGKNAIFYFGYAIEGIVDLRNATNGTRYLNVEYRIGADGYGGSYLAFNVSPDAGTVILAVVTLGAQYYAYDRVAACRRAVVYGGSYDDRILCWGGRSPSEMFCSQPVSDAQVSEACLWGNTSGSMYFPVDCNFRVGDGQYAVRAACRHYDRLLIFTEGDTWMADFSASLNKQFPVVPINSGVGCTAPGAAALAGNDPLTVANGAIWRWTSNSLRRDECSAECVSAGIGELFGDGFSTAAVAYSFRGQNEVWFADRSDAAGQVFIYHTELDAWYRFSGIRADGFLVLDGAVGFWRGSGFYRFDEARETDLDEAGEREIAARLVLDGLDFEGGERMNHLTRLALALVGVYPALSLVLETDLGRVQALSCAAGGRAGGRTLIDRPVRSGRFRALRLVLSAVGRARLRLCGLTLTAEPGARK